MTAQRLRVGMDQKLRLVVEVCTPTSTNADERAVFEVILTEAEFLKSESSNRVFPRVEAPIVLETCA